MTQASRRQRSRPRPRPVQFGRWLRARLYGEGMRSLVSVVAAIGTTVLVSVALYAPISDVTPQDQRTISGAVVGASVYQVWYVALSLTVFGLAPRNELEDHARSRSRIGVARRLLLSSEPGVGLAVTAAVAALVAAVWILPRSEDFQDILGTITLVAGIALIVGAWASMVTTYAIDYTLKDLAHRGLVFPGDAAEGFSDYLYFAVAVSTTFATSDVEVTSRRLRRTVIGHAIVAFAFNVVIVALVIAVIVR